VGVTGPAVFLADEKEALHNIDFKLLSAAAGAVTVLLLILQLPGFQQESSAS
jgi:hypothetical protein